MENFLKINKQVYPSICDLRVYDIMLCNCLRQVETCLVLYDMNWQDCLRQVETCLILFDTFHHDVKYVVCCKIKGTLNLISAFSKFYVTETKKFKSNKRKKRNLKVIKRNLKEME